MQLLLRPGALIGAAFMVLVGCLRMEDACCAPEHFTTTRGTAFRGSEAQAFDSAPFSIRPPYVIADASRAGSLL